MMSEKHLVDFLEPQNIVEYGLYITYLLKEPTTVVMVLY